MCMYANFCVSQLLYFAICQACIMLLTGHRFPRKHISLHLFHCAWHNLFSQCQKEGFIYPTMIWNLSIITCNCNRLQNTTHSSWRDLCYLKYHDWQHINRGYFKGMCYAGKKAQTKNLFQSMSLSSFQTWVYASLSHFCLSGRILSLKHHQTT